MKMKPIRRSGKFAPLAARTPFQLFVTLLALHSWGCGPASIEEVREMQSARQYARSLEPLRDMIDLGSKDPEVFYLYGLALSTTGEIDAAFWPLRKAMESSDWMIPAGLQLASDAFKAGNYDTTIAVIDRVLEIEPDHLLALVLRARARIETRRNLEEALADSDRALEIDPDLSTARVARVVALLGLNMVEEAAVALEEIEEFGYEAGLDELESARFCGARASFAKEKGETEKADERYTKCLELFPSTEILVADAIKFFEGIGKLDRAIEILEAALIDAPDSRDFRVGLVLRLTMVGKHERAEQLLREGTESKMPVVAARAWLDLAGYLIEREEMEAGVEAMEKVFELHPSPTPQLVFRYADTLMAAGRFDDALQMVDRMTTPAHRHLVLGRVYLARGQYALALEELSAGLGGWPENAVARYYAALAAEGIGDFERSIEELRYSIRAGADQTDARLRLAQLHNAEGQFKQAVSVLRHDIVNQPPSPAMAELEVEIRARAAGDVVVPSHLTQTLRQPVLWQRAVAAIARGTSLRSGPEAAEQFIRSTGADLTDPANALLLKAQTQYLAQAEKLSEGVALAANSLSMHRDVADFHAILGLALLQTDAGVEEARLAFDRALELDPDQPDALAGRGLLAQTSGDASAAIDFYLRADAANPEDTGPIEAAIDALIGLGRLAEAEDRLEELLEREPYSGPAALRLLELRVARGAGKEDRSFVLARLAMRFGGAGRAAADLLKVATSP
jgi:tetratricopeptide (TPR) repeat protein